jgi:hypothetical protein
MFFWGFCRSLCFLFVASNTFCVLLLLLLILLVFKRQEQTRNTAAVLLFFFFSCLSFYDVVLNFF